MNERIRALLEQSTKQINPDDREWVFSKVDQEKFAELIVQECIYLCQTMDPGRDAEDIEDAIRKYFGVECSWISNCTRKRIRRS